MRRRLSGLSLSSNRSAQLFGTMNDQMPAAWRSCERQRLPAACPGAFPWARIPQTGPDALSNQAALQLGYGAQDSENHAVSKGRQIRVGKCFISSPISLGAELHQRICFDTSGRVAGACRYRDPLFR